MYEHLTCILQRFTIKVLREKEMTVKVKLKELRETHNMTQREMALYLKTTETNYRRIETQKIASMSYDTLDKLCKLFKCSTSDVLEFTND